MIDTSNNTTDEYVKYVTIRFDVKEYEREKLFLETNRRLRENR